jgi:hypothetical protein
MAIFNLGSYWRRIGEPPSKSAAHADGRHALPPMVQAGIDDGRIRSTRNTPDYVGRHRAAVTP